MTNWELTADFKNKLVTGDVSKHVKRKGDDKFKLRYDRIVISKNRVEFCHLGELLWYMDIPGGVDLSKGDTLTLDGVKGSSEFSIVR